MCSAEVLVLIVRFENIKWKCFVCCLKLDACLMSCESAELFIALGGGYFYIFHFLLKGIDFLNAEAE